MASIGIQSPPEGVSSKTGLMKLTLATASKPASLALVLASLGKTSPLKDNCIPSQPEMRPRPSGPLVPIQYSEPPKAEPKPAPLPYAPDEVAALRVVLKGLESQGEIEGTRVGWEWKQVREKKGDSGGEWRGEMQDGCCCSKPKSPPPEPYPGT